MHPDVQALRDFYYRSALGRAARGALRDQVLRFWPEAQGLNVGGYGFAVPVLRPYLAQARRVMALMPAPQGVMRWPAGMPNVSVLAEEMLWPVETGHLDRLVVMHGLETCTNVTALLDECYRTLGPGGEVLFIVPNRSGLWARSETTPFGQGRPYSLSQLDTQLRAHDFLRVSNASVLYQPPSTRRFWMKTAPVWERIGRTVPAVMAGGVLMVRASKRYPPQRKGIGEKVRVPTPLEVLSPVPSKEPKPV